MYSETASLPSIDNLARSLSLVHAISRQSIRAVSDANDVWPRVVMFGRLACCWLPALCLE